MAEHGGIIVDGVQVASTLRCPHCGGHFDSWPGSGKRRAFCLKCQRVTCGHLACDPCIPIEARCDFVEGKKTGYDETIRELIARGASLL